MCPDASRPGTFFDEKREYDQQKKMEIMRKTHRTICLFMLFSLLGTGLFSAEEGQVHSAGADTLRLELAREAYHSRLIQVEFWFRSRTEVDSSLYLLRQEAEYFATVGDYGTALELLEELLNQTTGEVPTADSDWLWQDDSPDTSPLSASLFLTTQPNWQWSLESGVDYSRQEYEMVMLENDSVVVEQLSNPFLSLRATRNGILSSRFSYQSYQYLRADQVMVQASSVLSLGSTFSPSFWKLDGEVNLYWLHHQQRGSFVEGQLRGTYNRLVGNGDQLLFYGLGRVKHHFPTDSSYGDVLQGELNLGYQHYFSPFTYLQFNVRPEMYQESQVLGLRYVQVQPHAEFTRRLDYNRYLTVEVYYNQRTFRSRLAGSTTGNTYRAWLPRLVGEFPVYHPFGIAARMEAEDRRYLSPDVSHSDFRYYSAAIELRYYFGDYSAVGLGYVAEEERHFSANDQEEKLIAQENFRAGGVVFSLELIQGEGLMVNLSYSLTLRTYPNLVPNDFLSIYSNRRIHNIQGVGVIPFTRHWQFQFLVNYDNDRDRDREGNDNKNTIFNLSLVYSF